MRDSPKILILTNGYPNPYKVYAGMYLNRHVQFHREAGLEVFVLSPFDSRQGPFHSSWKHLKYLVRVLRALFFTNFDLIHAHWILPSGFYGALLSRLRRKPFVLTSHGDSLDRFGQLSSLRSILITSVLKSADTVIAVGKNHGRRVEQIAGLGEDKVKVIDMGVMMEKAHLSKLHSRQILDLSPDEHVIVFIGNLNREKGADILVRAAAELRKKTPFRLYIGGQGSEFRNLKSIIERERIERYVLLIGPVLAEQVPLWMSAADVCAVPSRFESFGLVAIEAMACNTPVVASNVGGLSENIVHGQNGLLFPSEDHSCLAECLYQLLCDPDLRARLAEGGRQTALVHEMSSQAAKVKDIYLSLLNQQV